MAEALQSVSVGIISGAAGLAAMFALKPLVLALRQFYEFKFSQEKNLCQKWDSNPRLHTETRIPNPPREGAQRLESGALDHSAILTLRQSLLPGGS